jgi:alpha-galactosidase
MAAAATAVLTLMVTVLALLPASVPLDNGRALLPPLGWSSWNMYATQVNETHIRDAAEALVSSGLAAQGWRTVVISDGWPGGRDAEGRLFGDRARFPSGMKALCQHIISLGLECGIYNSMGNTTCGGFTGGWRHEEIDAATYVDWGVRWY